MSKVSHDRLGHTPWVEKYRPSSLSEVASQDHATNILRKNITLANLPHMLFYGPPGTGKTSTILALAKELYGPNLYKSRVLELNASDERGISIVRDKIKRFARLIVSTPTPEDLALYPCPPYKIIILDEADSMTNDAQSALRRTIEKYSSITRFCLICNYITRIIDPLASRCSKFRFKLLNNQNALQRLEYIVDKEQVSLEGNEKSSGVDGENMEVDGVKQVSSVLNHVLQVSNGDLRKAITYLQSATKLSNLHGNDINISLINEIAGIISSEVIDDLTAVIQSKDLKSIISSVEEIILQGYSAQQVCDQLHDIFIFNDTINASSKNDIALILFEADKKLNNGTDEHIQLLNVCLKVSNCLEVTD